MQSQPSLHSMENSKNWLQHRINVLDESTTLNHDSHFFPIRFGMKMEIKVPGLI